VIKKSEQSSLRRAKSARRSDGLQENASHTFLVPAKKGRCVYRSSEATAWENLCELREFLELIDLNVHKKTPLLEGQCNP